MIVLNGRMGSTCDDGSMWNNSLFLGIDAIRFDPCHFLCFLSIKGHQHGLSTVYMDVLVYALCAM